MAEYPTDDRFKYGPGTVARSKRPPLVNPLYVRASRPDDDGQSCLVPPTLHYSDGSELSAYHPTPREQIASTLMGDDPSLDRKRLVYGLLGTTGGGNGSSLGGLLDWTPLGPALAAGDAAHDGDLQGVLLSVLPGAARVRRPTELALRGGRLVEREAARPVTQYESRQSVFNPPSKWHWPD